MRYAVVAAGSKPADRMSAKILRELKKEFPEAGAARVVIQRTEGGAAGGEHPVSVISEAGAGPVDPRMVARARGIWDASGGSLTQIQM